MIEAGKLYLVGTPIGNMGDISARAVEILSSVDWIAAEDTRRTGSLLEKIGSRRPTISFHSHNEQRRIPELLEILRKGESIAVASDAGNPGIADPAESLVRAAIKEGIDVVPIPGPSAFLAALTVSGLSTRRFRFEGFLPTKKGPRLAVLRRLSGEEATILFYESPKRVGRLMREIAELLGNRRVVLGREITKKFEEFFRGGAEEAAIHLESEKPRGEYVVLIEGSSGGTPLPDETVLELLREEVGEGRSMRDAVRAVAVVSLWKEQEIYRLFREKDSQ